MYVFTELFFHILLVVLEYVVVQYVRAHKKSSMGELVLIKIYSRCLYVRTLL